MAAVGRSWIITRVDDNSVYFSYKFCGVLCSSGDWVGLFPYGSETTGRLGICNHIQHHYTDGKTEGTGSFHNLAPGMYDVRLFLGPYKTPLVVSQLFSIKKIIPVYGSVVDNAIRAVAKGEDTGPSDWIGLYRADTKNNKQYLEWHNAESTTVEFSLPREPGSYELRYFRGGSGYIISGKSSLIEVKNRNQLSIVSITNENICVSWTCSTHAPTRKDWVGLWQGDRRISWDYCRNGVIKDTNDHGVVTLPLTGEITPDKPLKISLFNSNAGKEPIVTTMLELDE